MGANPTKKKARQPSGVAWSPAPSSSATAMVPNASALSRVPRARPRRGAGNSSVTTVTTTANSAPRKTREPNWKPTKDHRSYDATVRAVKAL